MMPETTEPCRSCAKRAKAVLEIVDRRRIPLPTVIRGHLEKTAANLDQPRRISVRQTNNTKEA